LAVNAILEANRVHGDHITQIRLIKQDLVRQKMKIRRRKDEEAILAILHLL